MMLNLSMQNFAGAHSRQVGAVILYQMLIEVVLGMVQVEGRTLKGNSDVWNVRLTSVIQIVVHVLLSLVVAVAGPHEVLFPLAMEAVIEVALVLELVMRLATTSSTFTYMIQHSPDVQLVASAASGPNNSRIGGNDILLLSSADL